MDQKRPQPGEPLSVPAGRDRWKKHISTGRETGPTTLLPSVERNQDVEWMTDILSKADGRHGVVNERILLWGLPGCGSVAPFSAGCS